MNWNVTLTVNLRLSLKGAAFPCSLYAVETDLFWLLFRQHSSPCRVYFLCWLTPLSQITLCSPSSWPSQFPLPSLQLGDGSVLFVRFCTTTFWATTSGRLSGFVCVYVLPLLDFFLYALPNVRKIVQGTREYFKCSVLPCTIKCYKHNDLRSHTVNRDVIQLPYWILVFQHIFTSH